MLELEQLLTEQDFDFGNLEALDEAYFGKPKELLEIEKLLDKYRKKYKGMYVMIGAAANQDKMLIKINRLFEKVFGFSDFTLFIIDTADINAFTYAVDCRFDTNVTSKKLVSDKTYKFNKKYDYACIVCVYAGLMFNPDFSTEEVMGIILHEIGHNFYAALSKTNAIFSSCNKAVLFAAITRDIWRIVKQTEVTPEMKAAQISGVIGTYVTELPAFMNAIMSNVVQGVKEAQKHHDDINDTIYTVLSCFWLGSAIYTIMKKAYNYGVAIGKALVLGPGKVFGAIIKKWLDGVLKTVKDPIYLLRLPNGFRNERTADNFAAIYGYGPALMRALSRMEGDNYSAADLANLPKAVPIIGCLIDATMLPINIINTALDPHPLTIQRTTDQIRMLEDELNKSNLDPKMKKRIQKDIDNMKKCVESSMDITKGITGDPHFVRHVVNRIMYNVVDAKSFRDVIFNFDPNGKYKSYDKTIDEICQNEIKK